MNYWLSQVEKTFNACLKGFQDMQWSSFVKRDNGRKEGHSRWEGKGERERGEGSFWQNVKQGFPHQFVGLCANRE